MPFTFPFKVAADNSVKISGLDAGKVTALHGLGQKWQLWHSAGHGYQSGRDWQYGAASHWIVEVKGDVLIHWHNFDLGRKWGATRRALIRAVDRLNENPDADWTPLLIEAGKYVRDYHFEQHGSTVEEKLNVALEKLFSESVEQ